MEGEEEGRLEEFSGLSDELAIDDGGLVLPGDGVSDDFFVLAGVIDVDSVGLAGDDLGPKTGFAEVDVYIRAVVDLEARNTVHAEDLNSEAVQQLDHRDHGLPEWP